VFLAFDDYRDKWAYNDAFHEPFIVPLEAALTIIVTLLCLWLCWKKIAQYQTYLTENFSSITEFEPTWIKGFLLSVIVLCLVWLGFEVYTQVAELSYVQQYPFFVVLSLIMIWFGLTAVSRTNVEYPKMKFVRADVDEAVEPSSETDSEPVKRSMDWSALGTQYAKMVCDNQWYLESKFSLQQMASRLATNENYVSKAINIGLQKNFNRIVNEARVKHAQELLNQDHCQSILSVAYDSGFSSKASFNRAFKDIIGMTPTQYVTQKKT
jgi:AraC-like DNA-binding protein